MASPDLLSDADRRTIVSQQLTQFAGEAYQHALALRRAEARLNELPEGDPDRDVFVQSKDRSARDLATLNSAIKVNQEALDALSG
jgi:hypothetical protein